ncbi:30S ribosomal protein S8 [Candidatus Uhrbacteria bacterium]|nr:30S ribosomal protein S8 [Candidatus Uhrbacteria bacterium]
MTDQIADLLTRIRNALAVRKSTVQVPYSRVKRDVVSILKQEGYISDFELSSDSGRQIVLISLKYVDSRIPAINALRRVSKPGCRVYAKANELPSVLNNLGIAIISTSHGVMTNREARKRRLGGEVLCEIS